MSSMRKRILPINARPPHPAKGDRIKVRQKGKDEAIGIVDRANDAWFYVRMEGPESQPKPFFPSQCSTLQGQRFA